MTDNEETEQWLDQWLGTEAFPASRDDLLKAMRDHALGEVIIATEFGPGLPLAQVSGILVEAIRDPEDWDEAMHFAVVGHEDASVWHNPDDMIKAAGRQVPDSGHGRAYVFIPEHLGEVLAYPGTDAGASGYRVSLGGGATLAIVLWQGALHETADGSLAPGIGAFTSEVDDEGEASS